MVYMGGVLFPVNPTTFLIFLVFLLLLFYIVPEHLDDLLPFKIIYINQVYMILNGKGSSNVCSLVSFLTCQIKYSMCLFVLINYFNYNIIIFTFFKYYPPPPPPSPRIL